jgi:DNA-binding transcriptional regulator PaaX
MFDKIDIGILGTVDRISGAPLAEIIKLCRKFGREDSTIRRRIAEMDVWGAVQLDRSKEKGKVFCIITGYGRDILAEGRKTAQPQGAGQHD